MNTTTKLSGYSLHILLFGLTFFTATLAGVQWLNKDPFELSNFHFGLTYSLALLFFLSSHEFGHYFAARIHKVSTTLPFFIPIPPFLNPFGTMGAVIRIRSPFQSRRSLFDVGIAGPIAGFIVTCLILAVGFMTLPGKEYLFSIHPEYATKTEIPTGGFTFGTSILFWTLCKIFSARAFVPPMNEIYHYPLLCAGWFGLFVTAMNLLPVGQLDGGHIMYSLVGQRTQKYIARTTFTLLILLGLTGIVSLIVHGALQIGTLGWLFWAAILYFIVKLEHPPIPVPDELTSGRKILGWASFLVFILTFPPIPFFE